MNAERRGLTAYNLSRIFENDLYFNVFKSQKIESLTHSFFFESFSSKVIFRVTQNSTTVSFEFPRKTLLCEAADHSSCARWLHTEKSAKTEATRSRWSQLWGIRLGRNRLYSVRLPTLPDGQCSFSTVCNV